MAKNPSDLTLRNLHKTRKDVAALRVRVVDLAKLVLKLEQLVVKMHRKLYVRKVR